MCETEACAKMKNWMDFRTTATVAANEIPLCFAFVGNSNTNAFLFFFPPKIPVWKTPLEKTLGIASYFFIDVPCQLWKRISIISYTSKTAISRIRRAVVEEKNRAWITNARGKLECVCWSLIREGRREYLHGQKGKYSTYSHSPEEEGIDSTGVFRIYEQKKSPLFMWEIASTVVAFFVLYWSYYIAFRKN